MTDKVCNLCVWLLDSKVIPPRAVYRRRDFFFRPVSMLEAKTWTQLLFSRRIYGKTSVISSSALCMPLVSFWFCSRAQRSCNFFTRHQAPGPMWLCQLCWLSAPGRDKLSTTKAGRKYNCFFEISMSVFSTSVFCFFITTDI